MFVVVTNHQHMCGRCLTLMVKLTYYLDPNGNYDYQNRTYSVIGCDDNLPLRSLGDSHEIDADGSYFFCKVVWGTFKCHSVVTKTLRDCNIGEVYLADVHADEIIAAIDRYLDKQESLEYDAAVAAHSANANGP